MDDFDCVASYADQIADCFVPGEDDDEDAIEERFFFVSDNWVRYSDFFADVQQ